MAKSPFDDQELSILGPNCGKETKGKLGRLRAHGDAICGACGTHFAIDTKKFHETVRSLEKRLKGLGRR